MKVWFDTEFYENGKTIELISIGAVNENGALFYAETPTAAELANADPWLANNVAPHLVGGDHIMERSEIAAGLIEFAGEKPEFWAYYADYDWVVLCQLFGRMIDLPKGWPMVCYDFRQWLDMNGLQRIRGPINAQHHALDDARWLAKVFKEHVK